MAEELAEGGFADLARALVHVMDHVLGEQGQHRLPVAGCRRRRNRRGSAFSVSVHWMALGILGPHYVPTAGPWQKPPHADRHDLSGPALPPTPPASRNHPAAAAYWAAQGCLILQPYDMEVGAGTFHPATFLRALGPEPWKAAYVQPCRRPEGRPLRREPEPAAALLPVPGGAEAGAGRHPRALPRLARGARLRPEQHDIRFVEDDWENPTLGAWGLGWEVWCDGMEVTQFTYFQQVGGIDCEPITGEITYGLERLAMYLQGVDNVYDLEFNGPRAVTLRRRVPPERGRAVAPTTSSTPTSTMLFAHFDDAEKECKRAAGAARPRAARLRAVHQGQPQLQPARRARRDQRDRARRAISAASARWRRRAARRGSRARPRVE